MPATCARHIEKVEYSVAKCDERHSSNTINNALGSIHNVQTVLRVVTSQCMDSEAYDNPLRRKQCS